MSKSVDPKRYTALHRLASDPTRRVVVSFGGGGVPGIVCNLAFAHLLEQLGLREHVAQIWGTSAGAVVGGGWASGAGALDVLEIVRGLGRGRAVDVQWARLATATVARLFGRQMPDGLVRGERFFEAIGRGLRVPNFEQAPTEFRCIAVRDDGSLQRKVFRKGSMQLAIFSSMSVPGIVVPRPHPDGTTYYDGGLIEKTPLLSPIAEHGRLGDGRRLLLLGTHFDNNANKIAARGFLGRFLQTIYAMEEVVWDYQLDEARKRADVDLLLQNPHCTDNSLFDFARVDRNFDEAFDAFADQLQNGKLGLSLGTI